jgi:hypothetical protein
MPDTTLSSMPGSDFRMPAYELISRYDSNEPGTNDQYLNKILSVSGVIKSISKTDSGGYALYLGSHTDLPVAIYCSLDSLYNPHRLFLRPGDSTIIRGTCFGRVHDIIMTQCIIEK